MDENNLFSTESPLLYCHFSQGIGEPKYMPVTSFPDLNKILVEALDGYNEINAAMNLVLFEDAICHILRINRILESPRGNALLVGVGGSGKQSLSRLAAYISSLEVFQVRLRLHEPSTSPFSFSFFSFLYRLKMAKIACPDSPLISTRWKCSG